MISIFWYIWVSSKLKKKKKERKEGIQESSDFLKFTYIAFVLDPIFQTFNYSHYFSLALTSLFTSKPRVDRVLDQCQVWYIIFLTNVQFSCSVMSNSLWPHGLQHTRPPCPSPTPGVYSNSCPSRWWCHPTISSSVIPFSSCPQSFPASGSFPMSQFFASVSQSIGVSASASVLSMNIQD